MGLDVSLSIANSGLAAISKQFAVISQNVSNANSPNYTNEAAALQADSAGSLGLGVRSNAATLTVNTAVQGQVFAQGASVAYASTAAAALSGIDQVMGAPDAGTDLPSLLGNLQSQFSALDADPGSQTQAQAVVGAAQTLTNQHHLRRHRHRPAERAKRSGHHGSRRQFQPAANRHAEPADRGATKQRPEYR
jgi:flagellar hook-associated protein 1 FlgK